MMMYKVALFQLYAVMIHKEVSAEQAVERCLRKLAPAGDLKYFLFFFSFFFFFLTKSV
jgi:hypothetical protein